MDAVREAQPVGQQRRDRELRMKKAVRRARRNLRHREQSQRPHAAPRGGHVKHLRLSHAPPAIGLDAGEGALVAIVAIGGQNTAESELVSQMLDEIAPRVGPPAFQPGR